MARFWVVLAVVAVAFMIYALVDCSMADRTRVRGPRKGVWILIVLLLPVIGAILWFIIGRGRSASSARPVRPSSPDDDPEFLARLRRESEQRERIRQLEEELADLDTKPEPDPDGKDGTGTADRRDG